MFNKNMLDQVMNGIKIRAICSDLNVPSDDAEIYVHLHSFLTRVPESERTVAFFDNPTHKASIEEALHLLEGPLGKILNAFQHMTAKMGKENNVGAQLAGIRKMFTDPAYRDQKFEFYSRDILPKLPEYADSDKIFGAIVKDTEKEEKEIKDLESNFNE